MRPGGVCLVTETPCQTALSTTSLTDEGKIQLANPWVGKRGQARCCRQASYPWSFATHKLKSLTFGPGVCRYRKSISACLASTIAMPDVANQYDYERNQDCSYQEGRDNEYSDRIDQNELATD